MERDSTSAAARVLLLLLVVALLVDDGSVALSAQPGEATEDIVVVLPPGVGVAGVLRDFDVRPTHRFDRVVNGFAAEVPSGIRRALERIPGAIVSPNRRVEATDRVNAEKKKCKKKKKKKCKKRGGQQPPPSPVNPVNPDPVPPAPVPPAPDTETTQIIPTGIQRIAAEQNPQAAIRGDGGAVDVDVAVFDTGIAAHTDLTIAAGKACTGEGTGDANGHGTHVAGTIGARDNGFGVVGVAPGARLYPVRVLDNQGAGTMRRSSAGWTGSPPTPTPSISST